MRKSSHTHTHMELPNMRGGTVGSCVVSRSGTELETQLVAGACLEQRILCRACLSLLLLLWQPLMALAHFWLLAAQHFVFQINLVSSTVLLCSGPSECPCLGQDMIMLDIAASRRAELALRFSCARSSVSVSVSAVRCFDSIKRRTRMQTRCGMPIGKPGQAERERMMSALHLMHKFSAGHCS